MNNNNPLIYLTPHETILTTLMEIFTNTVYIIILWGDEKVREVNNINNPLIYLTPHENILITLMEIFTNTVQKII